MSIPTIDIDGSIGRGPDDAISAAVFKGALDLLGEVDEVRLKINSPGGSVFETTAIISDMLSRPYRVSAEITGLAGSSAGFLAVSADVLFVRPESFLFVHRASSGTWGNANEHKKSIGILEKLDQSIAEIFARRAGGDVQSWLRALDEEAWFSGRELVDLGIATMLEDRRPVLAPTALLNCQMKVRSRPYAVDQFVAKLVANHQGPPSKSYGYSLAELAARAEEIGRDV